MRPYTYHASEVEAAVLSCLTAYEDEGRRLARLTVLAEDLVATIEALRRRIADDEGELAQVSAVAGELRAVPYLADAPFEVFNSVMGEVLGYRNGRPAGAESPYAAFEDLFRGPRERVTELQRPYLKLVSEHQPVLDLGCGRGEFLGLLRGDGIDARGVDVDEGMVGRCSQRGLTVERADALDYLDRLADASLGTVFSAQVIEHFSVDQLRRLLTLSLRKLEPEGLFIAETINPHSVQAMKAFWVDLTHCRPIFPEVALAMCSIAGFTSAYVFAPGYESFEQARFDAPSYAVVASCPGA